jgi:polyisoprenoid-binding protein YceI
MGMIARTLALIGLLGVGPIAGPVQAADYAFDKAHTQILFFVDHLGFSKSQGEFHDYDGRFQFDPEQWADAKAQITIRTASIDMDDYAWDKHLKSEDFFNVNAYPTMHFQSTEVEQAGENRYRLQGNLTLLGVTKPVTLDVAFNKAGIHPLSKRHVAGFSATGTIKRSDFGMDYALPMVGDAVVLRLEVEGVRVEP